MAGYKGNIAWLLAQAQAVKGTPATIDVAKAYKMPMTGGGMAPTRSVERLSETDASRDAGVSYVQVTGAEGSPEFYVRDKSAPFWLWAGFGSVVSTGTTPNYTHTITPGNTLPYLTTWRNVGDALYERFIDCKVGSINVSADAGSPLTMTAGITGTQTTRLTAVPDTGTPVSVESGAVYNFNRATVTLGGAETRLVSSFDMTLENNVTAQQTDDSIPYDVVEGLREVSLSFDMIFESLAEYNKFHYGGAAGTQIDPNIFTTSAVFTFTLGTNNEISFNLPSIAYEEFPVEADPGGDPITVSVSAVGQRSGSPIVTATVKNQVATYGV